MQKEKFYRLKMIEFKIVFNIMKTNQTFKLLTLRIFSSLIFCIFVSISLPVYSSSAIFHPLENDVDSSNTVFQEKVDFSLERQIGEDGKKQLQIKEIQIEGNRLISESQILEVLMSNVGSAYEKENIISDLEAIDKLGYFVRESIQATPEISEDGVRIKIRIEENSPITSVQYIGNKNISSDELSKISEILIAKPESVNKISEILDQIEKKYQEKGFVLSKVSGVDVDPDGVLTVKIVEGVIDKVVFEGNTKSKETFLKRFFNNTKSNEVYNEILLVQDLRNLNNTGFFENIQRKIEPSSENPEKYNLVVSVKEKNPVSFGFGGGVNTLSGGFGNVGVTHGNVFGNGEKLSLNGQLGTGIIPSAFDDKQFLSHKRTLQLEARYTVPYFLGSNTQFSVFSSANTFSSYQVDLAQENTISTGVSFNKPLGMNFFGGLDLIGEKVSLDSIGNDSEIFIKDRLVEEGLSEREATKQAHLIREKQLEGGNFLHFNPSISFDTRDSAKNTMSGWNNKLTFGQAVGIGSSSYSKLGIDIRKYVPVGDKDTLAFNIRGASALVGEIPTYNQFRAGGYYGVRGYRPFSELGIGSRSLLASAEYRTNLVDKIPFLKGTPLAENLKLVFFGDAGYVGGNKSLNALYRRLDTAASIGIGVRANVPFLGPIRVDYGFPLIKPLWDNGSIWGRLNFGFDERF